MYRSFEIGTTANSKNSDLVILLDDIKIEKEN